jgi:hypothetical protein
MTDPRTRRSWRISHAVVRFREHGTERVYGLPDPPLACKMGTESELRLDDPTGTVSRAHAELVPVVLDGEHAWEIRDAKSKNGLRCDGKPLACYCLRPGIEVSLGSLRLIAESLQLIAFLSVLRRFLGWGAEQQPHVDRALQSLREWALQRAELIVVGDGDLMSVMRRLHNRVIGEDVSFTWCDPAVADADDMVKTAAAGTLCVKVERPAEATVIVERWRESDCLARPQLILCAADEVTAAALKGMMLNRPTEVIHVPSLESRADELEEIIHEYAREVAGELRLPVSGLTLRDVEQLRSLSFRNLAEIEETALRLVTLRTWGVGAGAARLGLDRSTLRSWAQRRGLET